MTKDINEMPQFHNMVTSFKEPYILNRDYDDPILVKETLLPTKPIEKVIPTPTPPSNDILFPIDTIQDGDRILPPPPSKDIRFPIDVIQVEDHILPPPPPPNDIRYPIDVIQIEDHIQLPPAPKDIRLPIDVVQIEDHILPPPPPDIFPFDKEIIRDNANTGDEAFDPNSFGTNGSPEYNLGEENEESISTQQEWDRLGISKDEYLEIVSDIPVSWGTYGKSLTELKKMVVDDCQTCGGSGKSTEEQESVQVTAADGLSKVASGIKITGYTYPLLFLAITAAGGGLGFGVSKYFKQGMLGTLTLIAAGLMGASSIAFKIKPPVKA